MRGVDLPGEDYRNFKIARGTYLQCEQACRDDVRCKAWTYRTSRERIAVARCWLKASVPRRQSDALCTSGIKLNAELARSEAGTSDWVARAERTNATTRDHRRRPVPAASADIACGDQTITVSTGTKAGKCKVRKSEDGNTHGSCDDGKGNFALASCDSGCYETHGAGSCTNASRPQSSSSPVVIQ
jgi:hypothetical protein